MSLATQKPERGRLSQAANLGIDVGGTSIKAAVVGQDGLLLSQRLEVPTPQPATPETVGRTLQRLVSPIDTDGRVGIALPAPIVNSTVLSPANIDAQWIGINGVDFLEGVLHRPVTLINDADAAGVAESQLGAARGLDGLVLLLTLGTGIGSALLHKGQLIPNTELGMTPFRGGDTIEHYAAPSAMKRDGISEPEWARRFNEVIARLQLLLHPDLIILSGSITVRWSELAHFIEPDAHVVPGQFRGDGGIVGASMAARRQGVGLSPQRGFLT
ncbi:MAG TPA: ROK family protein [Acidimicrobiia bacterium]|nr:ROK family protein [Acidimicrobiia bacterium]